MKKLFTLTLLAIVSMTLTACSMQDPVEYNDVIVDALEVGDKSFSEFDTYATETEIRFVEKIQSKLNDAIKTQNEQITIVDNLGSYDDNDKFQKAAIAYLQTNKDLLTDKYQDIVDLRSQANESGEITDEINNKTQEIYEEMGKIIETQSDTVVAEQEAFATKNNIELEE